MSIEQLANLSEVIGVVLVIASLVYVAKQLRQTTDALHAQSRQSVLNSSQMELFSLMNNPALAKNLVEESELSADEHIALHCFLVAILRVREFSWLQYMNGQIDDVQWETELVVIQNVLGTTRTRLWWNTVGRHTFGARFSSFVDATIQNQATADGFWKSVQNWSAP